MCVYSKHTGSELNRQISTLTLRVGWTWPAKWILERVRSHVCDRADSNQQSKSTIWLTNGMNQETIRFLLLTVKNKLYFVPLKNVRVCTYAYVGIYLYSIEVEPRLQFCPMRVLYLAFEQLQLDCPIKSLKTGILAWPSSEAVKLTNAGFAMTCCSLSQYVDLLNSNAWKQESQIKQLIDNHSL